MAEPKGLIPVGLIESHIFFLRGQKAMLSPHLAELYQVEPRALVQAVKRNADRFPADFMFRLSAQEFTNLKSQFVISSWGGILVLHPMPLPNKVLQCSPAYCIASEPST